MNAQHLVKTAEHFTPAPIVEAARITLGTIDLDPASCWEANQVVKAGGYYDAKDDGLKQPWNGRVFLNPPGTCGLLVCGNKRSCSCKLVPRFWEKLVSSWTSGQVRAAIWVGFSLEQLQSLQKFHRHPLHFPICYPRKRISYTGGSPTHASYIALLHDGADEDMRTRFQFAFGEFGAVRF